MKGKTVAIIAVIFVFYVLLGAVCFHFIESENETKEIEKAKADQAMVMANLTKVFTPEQVRQLVGAMQFILSTGTDVMGNLSTPTKWDINSAFFFSGTVVTTIGFGNNAPKTQTGRNFCIAYALIGIPLCGFLLTGVGEKLGFLAKKLECAFYDRITCGYPVLLRLTYIAILLVIGAIIFITIPSLIFMKVEDWKISESWYFCFITLTTIGFGDYVIGTNPDRGYSPVYQWVCYLWIIVGMSFLALIISLLSDLMTDYASRLREEQKQRLKQLKDLTGKQLTRLGSSEKRGGHKNTADLEDGEGERVEEDAEETPLGATEKVNGNEKNGRDHINIPGEPENNVAAADV